MSFISRARRPRSSKVGGAGHLGDERVVFRHAEALDVGALPLGVRDAASHRAEPVRHVGLRVHAGEVVGVHLDVGIELLEGVRGCRIAAEEDRLRRCCEARCRCRARPTMPASAPGCPDGRRWSRSGRGPRAGCLRIRGCRRRRCRRCRPHPEARWRPGCPASGRRRWRSRRRARAPEARCRSADRRRRSRLRPEARGRWPWTAPDRSPGSSGTGADRPRRWSACRPEPGSGLVWLRCRRSTEVPKAVDDVAVALGFHLREDLGLDLQVPGVVELAGLEHRARRGGRVAAALEQSRSAKAGLAGSR
jgi:hypothetical protein